VAVIVWLSDLQLPMQSVPITTDVVSSNLDQGEVYNINQPNKLNLSVLSSNLNAVYLVGKKCKMLFFFINILHMI
jgi:hypothetical protein